VQANAHVTVVKRKEPTRGQGLRPKKGTAHGVAGMVLAHDFTPRARRRERTQDISKRVIGTE